MSDPISRPGTGEFVSLPRMSGGTLAIFDAPADTLDNCFRDLLRAIKANHDLSPDYEREIGRILHQDADTGPTVVEHSVGIVHERVRTPGPTIQVLVRFADPLDLEDAEGLPMHFLWVLFSNKETHPHVGAVAEFAQLMGEEPFRRMALAAKTPDELELGYKEALAHEMTRSVDELPDELRPTGKPFGGLAADIRRQIPFYKDDFTQGFSPKVVGATIFLFFACLAPTVAFGGLMATLTGGEIGAVEMLISTALCGVTYALFAGQPLTILGSTGPVTIFLGILYASCKSFGVPFLPTYAWVGMWTALFLLIMVATDLSSLIRFFTRFTDDTFAALICIIFINQALREIFGAFDGENVSDASALLSIGLSLGTFFIATALSNFRRTPYLLRPVREFFADFGPAISILSMACAAQWMGHIGLETLRLPEALVPSVPRTWWVNPLEAPQWVWGASALPALLAAVLLYLDQNITVRLVNSPQHRLRKGGGYHLDLLLVAFLVALCSLFGLPWTVAATVRSLIHVRALANTEPGERGAEPRLLSTVENRMSSLATHIMIGLALFLVPLLRLIPMPVLFGIFLYMGVTSLRNNQLFERLLLWVTDPKLYPPTYYLRAVPRRVVHAFTAIQAGCLALLWIVRSSPAALLFPLFIALLVPVRLILQRFFRPEYLALLDADDEPRHEETRFGA